MLVTMRLTVGLFGVAMLIALGCGGAGGGGSATTTPMCGTDFRTPNYATVTDPGTGQRNQLLHWATFPVSVYRGASKSWTFGPTTYDSNTMVTTALNRWVNLVPAGVTYQYVGSNPTTGISVNFSRISGPPTAGDPLGVTVLTFNSSTGELRKADTTVNYWDTMSQAEVAFGVVFTLTHELGHALFINGHSDNPSDTMYYAASTVETRTPTLRDGNTLDTAYCGVFPTAPLAGARSEGPWTTVKVYHRLPALVPSFTGILER